MSVSVPAWRSVVVATGLIVALLCADLAPANAAAAASVPTSSVPAASATAGKARQTDDGPDVGDVTAALTQAKSSGQPVEINALTTQFFDSTAQPDGQSVESDLSSSPERILLDGQWRDLDMSLGVTNGGVEPSVAGNSVHLGDGSGPAMASVGMASTLLPAAADAMSGDNDFADVGRATSASDPSVTVGFPGQGVAPQLNADTATYPGAAEGSDVSVTADERGFGVAVSIPQRPVGDVSVSFPLSVTGPISVEPQPQSAATGVDLRDTSKRPVGVIGAVTVTDSSVDPVSGGPRVLPGLLTVPADGKSMTVTVPAATMADPSLVFPLTATTSTGFAADAFGIGYTPAATPDRLDMRVGVFSAAKKARAFLRFPVSKIPAKSVVTSATFGLVQSFTGACGANNKMLMYPLKAKFRPVNAAAADKGNNGFPGPATTGAIAATFANANRTSPASAPCTAAKTGLYWNAPFTASVVQGWLNNPASNLGMAVTAINDSSSNVTWKRLCSTVACSQGLGPRASVPKMTVVWHPPAPPAPSTLDVSPRQTTFVTSQTPTVSATFGGPYPVTGTFTVTKGGSSTPAWSGSVPNIGSAAKVSMTVPEDHQLDDGAQYTLRATGANSGGASPAATFGPFTVDTTGPKPVTLTASTATSGGAATPINNGQWVVNADTTKPVTFAIQGYSEQKDVVAFQVTRDGLSIPNIAADASQAANMTWIAGDGWHVVSVSAVERSGNVSNPVDFAFGLGPAALTSPGINQRSAKYFDLAASAPKTLVPVTSKARLMWKAAGDADYAPVVGGLVGRDGTPWDGTLVTAGAEGQVSIPEDVVWDIAASQRPEGSPLQPPAVVSIRVDFVDGTGKLLTSTPEHPVQWVTHAFGGNFAAADLGPGQVALSTGELNIATTDATLPGPGEVSVGRSWLSFEGIAGPSLFGPGWSSSIPSGAAGVGEAVPTMGVNNTTVTFTYPDGSVDTFGSPSPNAGGQKYAGVGVTSQGGGYVQLTGTKLTYTLPDGSSTMWSTADPVGPASQWHVQQVSSPVISDQTRTFTQDATQDTDGYVATVTGRYTGGTTAGNCTALTLEEAQDKPGCRILTVHTSKLSTPPSDAGAYPGQVYAASTRVWTGTNTAVDQDVALYHYNNDGLLIAEWDPRLPTPLVSTYDYDQASGPSNDGTWALTSLTPASANDALIPYTFTYDEALRLEQITRDQPDGGPAKTFVVYGVPTGGGGYLPDLSPGTTPNWDQPGEAAPSSAVAVFAPDQLAGEDFTPPDATNPDDDRWQYATLSYLNGQGATVNTAVVGAGQWLIDTIEYDDTGGTGGQVVQSLSAADRASALASPSQCLTDGVPAMVCSLTSSSTRAAALTTYSVYSEPGIVTDTYGPTQNTQLANTTKSRRRRATAPTVARPHTHNVYNEGAPSEVVASGAALVTTSTSGAWPVTPGGYVPPAGGSTPSGDNDVRTTTSGYTKWFPGPGSTDGWTSRQPTTTTIQGTSSGPITTSLGYDADGNTIATKQPGSNGSDAGTILATYYSAGSASYGCGNRPGWDGLMCTSRPASQPVGTPLPITYVGEYSDLLLPTSSLESAPPGPVNASRTTATTYDQIGRATAITITGNNAGDPVGETTMAYATDTGLATSTTRSDMSVTTSYDAWGRVVSTTDTSGNTGTTTYNLSSEAAVTTDGFSATTFTYDHIATSPSDLGEHRGMVVSQTDALGSGIPGQWTAQWGTRGLTRMVGPNGVAMTQTYASTGALATKSYTTSANEDLGTWTQATNIHGQVVTETGPAPATESAAKTYTSAYNYDTAGRLTTDTFAPTGSATQTTNYTLDSDSNRTAITTQAGTTSGRTSTFDSADRILTTTPTGATARRSARTPQPSGAGAHAGKPARLRATAGSYAYDVFGRTLTLLGVDTDGPDVTMGWAVNDRIRTQQSGDTVMTFADDPTDRRRTATTMDTSTTTVNYVYGDSSDSPAALATTKAGTTVTEHFTDAPAGGMAITTTTTPDGQLPTWWPGTTIQSEMNLSNPHGDIIANIPNTPNVTRDQLGIITTYTPFGNPHVGSENKSPYGWEGINQRDDINTAALVTMGARIYNPNSGRFLSVDPIEGGNANDYTYPLDPINEQDLDGQSRYTILYRTYLGGYSYYMRRGTKYTFGARHICGLHNICSFWAQMATLQGVTRGQFVSWKGSRMTFRATLRLKRRGKALRWVTFRVVYGFDRVRVPRGTSVWSLRTARGISTWGATESRTRLVMARPCVLNGLTVIRAIHMTVPTVSRASYAQQDRRKGDDSWTAGRGGLPVRWWNRLWSRPDMRMRTWSVQ